MLHEAGTGFGADSSTLCQFGFHFVEPVILEFRPDSNVCGRADFNRRTITQLQFATVMAIRVVGLFFMRIMYLLGVLFEEIDSLA